MGLWLNPGIMTVSGLIPFSESVSISLRNGYATLHHRAVVRSRHDTTVDAKETLGASSF